jgi:chromosome segregation ATPase
VAVGETIPSLQEDNPERTISRLYPSGHETQDAAAATSPPASTDPPDEALENANLQRALRGLQRDLQDNTENWHRVAGLTFRYHARMVLAESQLAESRRQREVAAHVRLALESRLHSTQIRLTTAEIRAASAEDRLRALEREKDQIVADTVSLKQRLRRMINSK